jgi:hypothetical protein
MAIRKITLIKEWMHPNGVAFPEGTTCRVTQTLYDDLAEGGYIETSKPAPSKPKTARKKTNKQQQ